MASGNLYIKYMFEQLRALQVCVFCGSKDEVEFAHIKETKLKSVGRGRNARYYDIINNPECYAPMCKRHHRVFDNGEIEYPRTN